jgi:hypothetical protein
MHRAAHPHFDFGPFICHWLHWDTDVVIQVDINQQGIIIADRNRTRRTGIHKRAPVAGTSCVPSGAAGSEQPEILHNGRRCTPQLQDRQQYLNTRVTISEIDSLSFQSLLSLQPEAKQSHLPKNDSDCFVVARGATPAMTGYFVMINH